MANSTGARRELAELVTKIDKDIMEFTIKHHMSFINKDIFTDNDITLITDVFRALHELQWEMLNDKGK